MLKACLTGNIDTPLVAQMLGYSYQVTQKHAAAAAEPWSRYAGTEMAWIMTEQILR